MNFWGGIAFFCPGLLCVEWTSSVWTSSVWTSTRDVDLLGCVEGTAESGASGGTLRRDPAAVLFIALWKTDGRSRGAELSLPASLSISHTIPHCLSEGLNTLLLPPSFPA